MNDFAFGQNRHQQGRVIQVTWVNGRSIDVKKRFFQQIATDILEKGGDSVRTGHIICQLTFLLREPQPIKAENPQQS